MNRFTRVASCLNCMVPHRFFFFSNWLKSVTFSRSEGIGGHNTYPSSLKSHPTVCHGTFPSFSNGPWANHTVSHSAQGKVSISRQSLFQVAPFKSPMAFTVFLRPPFPIELGNLEGTLGRVTHLLSMGTVKVLLIHVHTATPFADTCSVLYSFGIAFFEIVIKVEAKSRSIAGLPAYDSPSAVSSGTEIGFEICNEVACRISHAKVDFCVDESLFDGIVKNTAQKLLLLFLQDLSLIIRQLRLFWHLCLPAEFYQSTPLCTDWGPLVSSWANSGGNSDEKVDRRNVHPIRYVSVAISCRPVPRVSHTEPSRFVSAPTIDLVRPLSLTEELRLCQNIEHYQLSI
jgi:hypothetical protein